MAAQQAANVAPQSDMRRLCFWFFLEVREAMSFQLFLTQKVFLENSFLQIFNLILCLLH